MNRMEKLFSSNALRILLGVAMFTPVYGGGLNGKHLWCERDEPGGIYTTSYGWEFTDSSVYQWGYFRDGVIKYNNNDQDQQDVTYQLFPDEIVISYWSPRFKREMNWVTLNRNTLVMDYTPVLLSSSVKYQCELVSRTKMIEKIEAKVKTWESKRYPDRKL